MKNIKKILERLPLTPFIPLLEFKPVLFIEAEKGIKEVFTDDLPVGANSETKDITENMYHDGDMNIYQSSVLLQGKKSFLVESEYISMLGQNSITGSFRDDIAGWQCKSSAGTVLSGKLTHETNPAHIQKGIGAMKHLDITNADNTIEPGTVIAIAPGQYTLSFFAQAATGQTISDFVRVFKASDNSVLVTSGSKALTTSFQEFSVTFFTATPISVYFKIKTGIANSSIWFDSANLVQLGFAPVFYPGNRTKPNFTYKTEQIFNQKTFSLFSWFRIRKYDSIDSSFHIIWELTNTKTPESYIRVGYNTSTLKLRIELQNELLETFVVEGSHPALVVNTFYGVGFQYDQLANRFLWVLTDDLSQQMQMSNQVVTSLSVAPELSVSYMSLGHKYGQNDKQSIYISGMTALLDIVSEEDARDFLISTNYPYSTQEAVMYSIAKELYKVVEAGNYVLENKIFSDNHLKLLLKERGQFPEILPWAESVMLEINYYGYADVMAETYIEANEYRAKNWQKIVRDYGTEPGLNATLKLLTNDPAAEVHFIEMKYFVNELFPPADLIYMSEDWIVTASFTNETETGGRYISNEQILSFINKYVAPVYLNFSKEL